MKCLTSLKHVALRSAVLFLLPTLIWSVRFTPLQALGADADAAFDTWTIHTSHREVRQIEVLASGAFEGSLAVRTTGGFYLFRPSPLTVEAYNSGDGKYRSSARTMAVTGNGRYIWFGYENGMLARFDTETRRFRNFNDISRNDRFLSNRINDMVASGDMLYIATDFGVVLFDAAAGIVVDSYTRFGSLASPLVVNTIDVREQEIFIGTATGAASGNTTQDLKLAENWDTYGASAGLTNEAVQLVRVSSNGVYAVTENGNFRFDGVEWSATDAFGSAPVVSISRSEPGSWLVSTGTGLFRYDTAVGQAELLTQTTGQMRILAQAGSNGQIFTGTNLFGLGVQNDAESVPDYFIPNSPSHNLFQGFRVSESGEIVGATSTAPGSFNIGFTDTGFNILNDGNWENFNPVQREDMQQVGGNSFHITATQGNQYFFGSWGSGVLKLNRSDGELFRYTPQNSNVIGFSPTSSFTVITGLEADRTNADHVWAVSWSSVDDPLMRYSISDGEWVRFPKLAQVPADARYRALFSDSFGQLWVTLLTAAEQGRGLLVVRDPSGESEESAFRLTTADDSGALPNERVNAIIQDRRGEVWVGTDVGIGRFLFPDRIVTGSASERRAQQLISSDTTAFDRVLLRNLRVSAMAVDANNQKWIGSLGDGLYHVEESGRAILKQFTADNSPLTSNNIRSLAVNQVTGEVIIATDNELAVYQALEQEGRRSMDALRVYPNPYSYSRDFPQPIVIEDLSDNATISVLTVDGRLVRRFSTRGGRVVWDGLDDAGRRVSTGVYIIVATGNNNDQVGRARVVIVQ